MNEVLKVELDKMVEQKDGLEVAIQPRSNLEETNKKIRENVKSKMAKYLEPLLEVPSADNYQLCFFLNDQTNLC